MLTATRAGQMLKLASVSFLFALSVFAYEVPILDTGKEVSIDHCT